MLDWLQSFGNFLLSIGDFLISFFKNVVELVNLVFKGFAYVALCIQYLPIQYQVVFLVLISFSVIVTVVHFGG